jgi:two-component system response regulator YesN
MPYKVLIVDDEPMIRFGLSSCMDWQGEGFELVGAAANGEAALELIGRESIDILITDIKMPLMDGLQLTRRVKDLIPHVKVVFVSSFSDFEYAREAVKLGVVVDYLLKPTMEPEDLQDILRACKMSLDQDTERAKQYLVWSGEESRTRQQRLEVEFRQYLNGLGEPPAWKPECLTDTLRLAVWKRCSEEEDAGSLPIAKLLRLEAAKERLDDSCPQGLSFLTGDEQLVMIIADRYGRGLSDITNLHRQLLNDGERYTVGISPIFHELTMVRDAYEWALSALDNAFFEDQGRCYEGSIPAPARSLMKKEQEEEANRKLAEMRESFSQALASFDHQRCIAVLEEIASIWRLREFPRATIIAQSRGMLAMMWSIRFEWKTDESLKIGLERLQDLDEMETLEEVAALLRKELSRKGEPTNLPLMAEDANGVHVIQMALSYIQEHYKDDLTLQKVADFVYMSKNYFSEQFKRHTGYNFIDFVIRLRIHHAKHLLETTNLKVIDIGLQSGFHSPKHFLKLFKRLEGNTPAEYREQCRHRHRDIFSVQGG